MAKTTKTDFREFETWIRYYERKFGLMDWNIDVKHEDLSRTKHADAIAWCYPNMDNKFCCIRLNKTLPNAADIKVSMRRVALHEIIHVILDPLYDVAWARFLDELQLKQKNEQVATHLSNIIESLES